MISSHFRAAQFALLAAAGLAAMVLILPGTSEGRRQLAALPGSRALHAATHTVAAASEPMNDWVPRPPRRVALLRTRRTDWQPDAGTEVATVPAPSDLPEAAPPNPFKTASAARRSEPRESSNSPVAPRVEFGPIEAIEENLTPLVEPLVPVRPQPVVTFEAIDEPRVPSETARLEARIAGLQRQIERLSESQSSRGAAELERTAQLVQQVQQMQQTAQLQSLETQIRQLQLQLTSQQSSGGSAPAAPVPPAPSLSQTPPDVVPPAPAPAAIKEKDPGVLRAQPREDGSELFSLQIQDAEMAQVLEMLGQMSGENVLVGKDVTGRVSANLKDVNLDQALSAILRTHGYVYERADGCVFVMTPAEAEQRRKLGRKLITKIYRPHYISVKELQALITPLITEGVGKISVTLPAENGIASDAENAGGDRLSQRDALLVQDYPEVIEEIDGVMLEMDVPPLQVMIEAVILSVKLTDRMELGVNFALLNGGDNALLLSGNGQQLNNSAGFPGTAAAIIPPASEFLANTAGLKLGLIRGDVSAFIKALEEITDTNTLASPTLRVLNKQKAQLIIGDRISYRTLAFNGTQTVENVNFLDAGTRLILRPFIAPDGLIRMEVHPERSSAVIDPATGLPNQATTEVTTNIMVRDGTTAVIGGLIAEEIVESQQRIPYLGALPIVGNAFRNRTERVDRTELIVLITPRIVTEPETVLADEAARYESERRAQHVRDDLAPVNRLSLGRMEYERAQYFYDRGELVRAHYHIRESLRHHKNSLEALRLRDVIETAMRERNRKWLPMSRPFADEEGGPPPEEVRNDEGFSTPVPPRVADSSKE